MQIRIVSWQGSPEATRGLMKPGLPSHKVFFFFFQEILHPQAEKNPSVPIGLRVGIMGGMKTKIHDNQNCVNKTPCL